MKKLMPLAIVLLISTSAAAAWWWTALFGPPFQVGNSAEFALFPFVLDATNLYYSPQVAGGGLSLYPLNGNNAPQSVIMNNGWCVGDGIGKPARISTNGTVLFVTTSSGCIGRTAKTPLGGATVLNNSDTNGAYCNVYNTTSDELWWIRDNGAINAGTVQKISAPATCVPPCVIQSVVTATSRTNGGCTKNSTRFFWTDKENGVLYTVPLAGGAATQVASGLMVGSNGPYGAAANDTNVFVGYFGGGTQPAKLRRVRISDGVVTDLWTAPDLTAEAREPVIDSAGVYVYWGDGVGSGLGHVYRMPVAGGPIETVASNQTGPIYGALGVDVAAKFLYYANYGAANVGVLDKVSLP